MQDLFAYLIGLFLLGPLEARLTEKLQTAHVPQNIVSQVQDCARAGGPAAVDRIMADPIWGLQAVVRVWSGTASPDAVLADALPGCRPAIEAAQPFLRRLNQSA